MIDLFDEIKNYKPINQQEEHDKEQMLWVYCWHKRRESYEHLGESKRRITDHE